MPRSLAPDAGPYHRGVPNGTPTPAERVDAACERWGAPSVVALEAMGGRLDRPL